MPNNSYEFGYMSPVEKRKILISKCALMFMVLTSFFWILDDTSSTLSSDLAFVSAILCAIFGYINLLNIKSELMELFEPPYTYVGYEFIIIGMVANIASFVI